VWLERALHACEQALAMDGQNVRAMSAKAGVNLLMGRLEEAEAGFREALRLSPDEMNARTGLVELHRRLGRLAEAEDECRRAIAMRPSDWVPWNLLGATHFDMGRYDEAISAWHHVIQLTPDNARAYYNIGAAHFRAGRMDDAEQAYRVAVQSHPSGPGFTGLGTVLFYKRQMAEAEEAFQKAAGLRPRDARMWGNVAAARRWLPGREAGSAEAYDQAIRLAREQLAVNPSDTAMKGNLAAWLASRGEFAEAQALVEAASREDPHGAHIHAHAVSVFELAGRRMDALKALEQAIRLGYGWAEFELDYDLQRLRTTQEFLELRVRLSG
jgi:superkiller protein 3